MAPLLLAFRNYVKHIGFDFPNFRFVMSDCAWAFWNSFYCAFKDNIFGEIGKEKGLVWIWCSWPLGRAIAQKFFKIKFNGDENEKILFQCKSRFYNLVSARDEKN